MVEKDGLKLPIKKDLTQAEKEVIHLISDEFLTIKQIAQRRHSSIQAVYKILKSAKNKGAIDLGLNRVEKVESTFNQSDIRLHGQEFHIKILYQDNKYQELLEKSNIMFLDGNTIRLYKNAIEIYSGQSFYGKSCWDSESKSLAYFQGFIAKLEHNLKISLLKPRSRNIKIVNQHYARGNSEIADNSIKNRQRVWVYAEEDGKLCFITDDSFGFKEDELVHPITAKPDRIAVDKQVNDWRLNNPPTNSELANHIKQVTDNQLMFAENMKSHIEAIQSLSKGVKKLTRTMKGILRENQILRLDNKHQKRLGEFL